MPSAPNTDHQIPSAPNTDHQIPSAFNYVSSIGYEILFRIIMVLLFLLLYKSDEGVFKEK